MSTHIYIACFVGVIFGILWQAYEAQSKYKSNFRIKIFADENKWRWAVGTVGSFILVRYGMAMIVNVFVGPGVFDNYPEYVDITAVGIGVFGFRLVKILMKKGDSKLNPKA